MADEDTMDAFFDSLLTDEVMKKVIHMIAKGFEDEKIIEAIISGKRGGAR